MSRRTTLLGEDEGREGQGAGAGRDVECVGEDRASPGRVALQQIGNALRVEHRRAVRAGRAQTIPGGLRVVPHRLDTIPAQDRAQVGLRAFHRAPVGKDSRRGGTFYGRRPALGLARPTEKREDEGAVRGDGAEVLG